MSSEPIEELHYVPGSKVPGYEEYCPITQVWGYRQPDGTFLADGEITIDPKDFIDNPGFLIVHLGHSIEREHTVDTAAHALHSSMQALFAACDVPVDIERVRTSIELSEFMKTYRSLYTNLILIGHGSTEGISFLDKPNPIRGVELAGLLGADEHPTPLQILSLCCHSGCEQVSKALSLVPGVSEVIAPSGSFDMRWAVHFVVGFYLSRYINDLTTDDSIQATCACSRMRLCIWRNGQVTTCAESGHPD